MSGRRCAFGPWHDRPAVKEGSPDGGETWLPLCESCAEQVASWGDEVRPLAAHPDQQEDDQR